MSVLLSTNDVCWLHDTGSGHPERAERLDGVQAGIVAADLGEAVTWVEAPRADVSKVLAIHPGSLLDEMEMLCQQGGGAIDPDTRVSPASADAAWVAAGAGLDLAARLRAGEADMGWALVRPPGHHALPRRQMGFCLINNIAVTARALADAGDRVAIVDVDAHHGNGTQDIFFADPRVLFVSLHQYPWYPYTGRAEERGTGAGLGTTLNVPLPSGTSGPVYQMAIDTVVTPAIERHAPDWLLISAGFDGHRADPLTELALTAGDYADAISALVGLVPPGRRLLFLEGGYNLDALGDCTGSVLASAVGASFRPEAPSEASDRGREAVERAREMLDEPAVEVDGDAAYPG